MAHRRTNPNTFRHSQELRQNPTEAETFLWQALRMRQLENIRFRRQHAIGPFIVDFCAPRHKIIIELDGGQHHDQAQYDAERTSYLKERGFCVLRFWNSEVMRDRDAVIQAILGVIEGKIGAYQKE